MSNFSRTEILTELVRKVGSVRKAEKLILESKGVAPSKSSIYRALKGSGTDYYVQCMIDDLSKALRH